MDKEQFSTMMSALDTRKDLCKIHLGSITSTDDLSKTTLAAAADLKNFCIAEETIMTNIVMVDLYHVIGMGNLSPTQMMKFTYSMQEYLEYRPIIKSIVKNLDSIMSLPKIPVKTQYKLQRLGDVVLTKGEGPVVDESTGDTCLDTKDLPFSLDGRVIKVDLNQLDYFATLWATINKTKLSCDTFRQKCLGLKEYAGIQWTTVSASEAIGNIKANDIYARVVSYCNKRKMDC
jgi:hypothetical protein